MPSHEAIKSRFQTLVEAKPSSEHTLKNSDEEPLPLDTICSISSASAQTCSSQAQAPARDNMEGPQDTYEGQTNKQTGQKGRTENNKARRKQQKQETEAEVPTAEAKEGQRREGRLAAPEGAPSPPAQGEGRGGERGGEGRAGAGELWPRVGGTSHMEPLNPDEGSMITDSAYRGPPSAEQAQALQFSRSASKKPHGPDPRAHIWDPT